MPWKDLVISKPRNILGLPSPYAEFTVQDSLNSVEIK